MPYRLFYVVSRDSWNAREPSAAPTVVQLSERTGFTVHHSAGNPNETVRSIQDFHMDSNGWDDIGYNFLIDTGGRVYQGRGEYAVGAHAPGGNTDTFGVCLIGSYENSLPTTNTLNSARRLYEDLCIMTGKTLARHGHRDFVATVCPGDTLYEWVQNELGDGHPTVPPTTGWLEELIVSLPEIREGASGPAVRRVQGLCIAFGGTARNLIESNGGVDGQFGPGTDRAVRAVQAAAAPPVDGIVGQITWTKLVAG